MLKLVLGLNWKTTLAGLTGIGVVAAKIAAAWKAKDFSSVFYNGQELLTDIGILLVSFGLIKAKDQNVTGVGDSAKLVHSDGSVETH